jgi:hypothetical protein
MISSGRKSGSTTGLVKFSQLGGRLRNYSQVVRPILHELEEASKPDTERQIADALRHQESDISIQARLGISPK